MRILFHHRTVSKDGMDVHIQELVAAFRRLGHDVKIVGPASADNEEFGSDGGILSKIRTRLPRFLSEILELAYDQVAYRRLEQAYEDYQPDLVYERYNLFLMAGMRLKEKYGMPFILEVNAPLVHERALSPGLTLKRLATWCEQSVWKTADYVLPVSGPLADMVLDADVPEDHLHILHNGINPARFSDAVDADAVRTRLGLQGKTVLGFTGFMRPWHGLERVLAYMAAKKNDADLFFLIVGEGPVREVIDSYAKEWGIADRVHITGVVPRDQVAAYVAAFDVALQPSAVAYCSPLKLFEYMAMGKAILAPDQTNIREIVRHGESAYLIDAKDDVQFAQALEDLCGNAALRSELGDGARRRIVDGEFLWDRNAEKIVALAQSLYRFVKE